MATRRLSDEELAVAYELLNNIRSQLAQASNGDTELEWALRRKLWKELQYDERGKPMRRKLLKLRLYARQQGKCAYCGDVLPERYTVIDRIEAMKGYTLENTRLLCMACDRMIQQERAFS